MTRCVLTAAVIYFLQERCGKPVAALWRLQLSPDGWLHASAQSSHAVKRLTPPGLCAAIGSVPGTCSAACNFRTVRARRAEGQKSYWERFHGDVTVKRSPWLNPAKFGASGEFCINDFGSTQDDDDSCNIAQ